MQMQRQQLTRALTCSLLISIMITSLLVGPTSGLVLGHSLNKRSFFEIQCKGVYDKSIFARLDRICEDCYNLFLEPQLHTLCRSKCFSSPYFKGCIEALLLTEEEEKFNKMAEFLGKK
ncbi:ion transport peptide-like isoform X2 [Periplaneta americana]|uniref:ion transport peptide-like isoform X2 n=1 Tax=Periplaneta americana TaxID=6978 RepID=UPI0037E94D9E